jgi:hypothetical protein
LNNLTRIAFLTAVFTLFGCSQSQSHPEARVEIPIFGPYQATGFLTVTAKRLDGVPRLVLRHHGVDGNVLNEDVLIAN